MVTKEEAGRWGEDESRCLESQVSKTRGRGKNQGEAPLLAPVTRGHWEASALSQAHFTGSGW